MEFLKTSKTVKKSIADRVRAIIDRGDFVMFFSKDNDVFGATEDGRIVFASLKNPGDEEPIGWDKEATFMAKNLSNMIRGGGTQVVFDHSDLKKIHIIDSEVAYRKLLKQSEIEPIDRRIKLVFPDK